MGSAINGAVPCEGPQEEEDLGLQFLHRELMGILYMNQIKLEGKAQS